MNVKVQGRDGEVPVIALVDCGASSTFISPNLLRKLRLGDEARPANVTTFGLNGQILQNAKDSRKIDLRVRYSDDLNKATKRDILCVPIKDYDLVLGLPWFKNHKPEIDWEANRVLGLRTPQEIAQLADPIEPTHNTGGSRLNRIDIGMLVKKLMSEYLDGNSEEIVDVFYLKMWKKASVKPKV